LDPLKSRRSYQRLGNLSVRHEARPFTAPPLDIGDGRSVPAHGVPRVPLTISGHLVGRESRDVSFQQTTSGIFSQTCRMVEISTADPEEQIRAILPDACDEVADLQFRDRHVGFPDEYLLSRLQILEERAVPELASCRLLRLQHLRIDLALMPAGMVQQVPLRFSDQIFARRTITVQFADNRRRVSQARKAAFQGVDRSFQAMLDRNEKPGKPQNVERLCLRIPLEQAKLAIIAEALKLDHDIPQALRPRRRARGIRRSNGRSRCDLPLVVCGGGD
jgi:hypothetical protein